MVKRTSEVQISKDDYDNENSNGGTNADDVGSPFQRATAAQLQQRRIVTSSSSRKSIVAASTANSTSSTNNNNDNSSTSNPFSNVTLTPFATSKTPTLFTLPTAQPQPTSAAAAATAPTVTQQLVALQQTQEQMRQQFIRAILSPQSNNQKNCHNNISSIENNYTNVIEYYLACQSLIDVELRKLQTTTGTTTTTTTTTATTTSSSSTSNIGRTSAPGTQFNPFTFGTSTTSTSTTTNATNSNLPTTTTTTVTAPFLAPLPPPSQQQQLLAPTIHNNNNNNTTSGTTTTNPIVPTTNLFGIATSTTQIPLPTPPASTTTAATTEQQQHDLVVDESNTNPNDIIQRDVDPNWTDIGEYDNIHFYRTNSTATNKQLEKFHVGTVRLQSHTQQANVSRMIVRSPNGSRIILNVRITANMKFVLQLQNRTTTTTMAVPTSQSKVIGYIRFMGLNSIERGMELFMLKCIGSTAQALQTQLERLTNTSSSNTILP
jgi:NUP50 (Nucleoporin 50 kDa)